MRGFWLPSYFFLLYLFNLFLSCFRRFRPILSLHLNHLTTISLVSLGIIDWLFKFYSSTVFPFTEVAGAMGQYTRTQLPLISLLPTSYWLFSSSICYYDEQLQHQRRFICPYCTRRFSASRGWNSPVSQHLSRQTTRYLKKLSLMPDASSTAVLPHGSLLIRLPQLSKRLWKILPGWSCWTSLKCSYMGIR